MIKRLAVKIGTSTLTYETGALNIRRVESLVKVLSDIKNAGVEIIIITSGAVGVGMGKLGILQKPSDTATKQACAAVGQCELMHIYDKLFMEYNHTVAQVLLTRDVTEDTLRRENVQNTLEKLLSLGAIPIVNENDTVSVEELLRVVTFGDNDTLSAIVSDIAAVDLLVIMSDIDGLYDGNPKENPNANLIKRVSEINEEIESVATGAGSSLGTGGMQTKIEAAKILLKSGIDMRIVSGANPLILYDILDGKEVGTLFSDKGE